MCRHVDSLSGIHGHFLITRLQLSRFALDKAERRKRLYKAVYRQDHRRIEWPITVRYGLFDVPTRMEWCPPVPLIMGCERKAVVPFIRPALNGVTVSGKIRVFTL